METKAIDYILSTLCISLLLLLSILTIWALSVGNSYYVLIELFLFLFFYGTYTAALLGLLRKFKPYPVGNIPMDSVEFTYWKLNAVLMDLGWKSLAPFNYVFTEPLLLSIYGCRVGKNLAIGGLFRDYPLIELADYATIGQNSVIVGHAITHNSIMLKPVKIGRNAVVGINSVVMPGVTLGENAVLAPGAVATINTQIPSNELWGGIPARKIKDLLPPGIN
jgi:carbonic anhydrase/acetyltransferase-like protein (isoleucine patch superfamily)